MGCPMSEEAYDPEIAAIEARLASLVPASGRIDRDRLMFRAGQMSVPRRGWAWPAATAAMTLVAAALGGALVLRPAPSPIERIVYVRSEQPAGPTQSIVVTSPPTPKIADGRSMPQDAPQHAAENAAPWQAGPDY